jgi:serine/threonine-protein kinase
MLLSGRYRLTSLLAVGGMAEVWRADDTLLGRSVAVKVLHRHLAADPAFVARFRSEAVAAARLHHPGIVAVFDTCSDGGVEAIVLELVEGHTLRQHLDAHGPLPAVDAIDIAAAVADALEVAHGAGLVHRDVKPANILLCLDDRVMITDFGIAKLVDTTDHTATGAMLGSVKYLSPEQVEGAPVDGRSDVFSLGIVLYEMLAGSPPWIADQPAAIALARLHSEPPPLAARRPDLPRGLDTVVRRALAVDPAARFPAATDLRDALRAVRAAPVVAIDPEATVLAERPQQVSTPHASPPTPPPTPTTGAPTDAGAAAPARRRWRTLAVTGLVVTAMAVTGLLLWDSDRGNDVREVVDELTGAPEPLAATARAYDPEGTGPPGENDATAPLAVDGDVGTAWVTEGYDARTFGVKRGVGLVLEFDGVHRLTDLTTTSPTEGWSYEVYVATDAPPQLDGWGEPVATASGIPAGEHRVELGDVAGDAALVWITDLGEPVGRHKASVAEVSIVGAAEP